MAQPAAPHAGHSHAGEKSFGAPTDPSKARRTVRVDMTDDMRFTPAEIRVRRGDTVRFVAANKGQVLHEMVLGTMEELQTHAEEMRRRPGEKHAEPHIAQVTPGKSGEIGWRFTTAGTYYYACLIPGHFEAGMIGKVTVSK
jgi:uncharacterized cupredoxin-like copper-binding protein